MKDKKIPLRRPVQSEEDVISLMEERDHLQCVVDMFLPADTAETLDMLDAIMKHPDGIEGFVSDNGRISLTGYAQSVTELLHRALHPGLSEPRRSLYKDD